MSVVLVQVLVITVPVERGGGGGSTLHPSTMNAEESVTSIPKLIKGHVFSLQVKQYCHVLQRTQIILQCLTILIPEQIILYHLAIVLREQIILQRLTTLISQQIIVLGLAILIVQQIILP